MASCLVEFSDPCWHLQGGGRSSRAQVTEGSTSVLHLFHHFAIGVFYLLRVGDIQLDHREVLRAGSSQFLCS